MSTYIKRHLPNLRSYVSTNSEDYNDIISNEIEYWGETNPYYVKYFNLQKVKTLIDICKIVSENNTLSTNLISDFISGLALYPIYLKTKDDKQGEEVERLIKPVLELLVQEVTSEDYFEKLHNTLAIDPGLVKRNQIDPPITKKELFIHSKRINIIALSKSELSSIKDDWEKWLIQKNTKGKSKSDNQEIISIPRFKTEEKDNIVEILKDYFPGQHDLLRDVISKGELKELKLLFYGSCRTLLDFFKQLMKGHFLTIQVQSDLEKWIEQGFEYIHRGKPKEIKAKYASKIISGSERAAEGNRLIEVINENGVFKIIQVEITSRKQR